MMCYPRKGLSQKLVTLSTAKGLPLDKKQMLPPVCPFPGQGFAEHDKLSFLDSSFLQDKYPCTCFAGGELGKNLNERHASIFDIK